MDFLCLGDGNPVPTVDWTLQLENRFINWTPKGNLNNVTFKAKANSSGLYQCTIENNLGKAFKSFDLGK